MKKLISATMALSAIIVLGACSTDDSVDEQQALDTQQAQAINFDTYLGQSATSRGTISQTSNTSCGIYAMYTDNVQYVPETNDPTTATTQTNTDKFVANFMDNIELKQTTPASSQVWEYKPLRYWPMTNHEFLTFIAYGPYKKDNKLYTKTTTGEGTSATTTFTTDGSNNIYYKYSLADKAKDTYDFIWNHNITRNLYFYWDNDNNKWNFPENTTYQASNHLIRLNVNSGNNYAVQMDMGHACARIAYVVSAPALEHENNYVDGTGTEDVESGAQITVNKIVLLGDDKSATGTTITGAFAPEGYFNITGFQKKATNRVGIALGTTQKGTGWEGIATDNKKAFIFSKDDFVEGSSQYTAGGRYTSATLVWKPTTTTNNVIKGVKSVKNSSTIIKVTPVGTPTDDYLFIIPQDFSTDDGDKLYCYINYTVHYNDITSGTVKDKGITYEGYGQIKKNFEGGKAYVINIEIGVKDGGSGKTHETDFNAIRFNTYVNTWPKEESTDVTVNGTQTNY